MNYQQIMWTIDLPPPPTAVELIHLSRLSKGGLSEQSAREVPPNSDHIKSKKILNFNQLMTRVLSKDASLSQLDWLIVLRCHRCWDELPADQSAVLVEAVIHASKDFGWLKSRLLWTAVFDWGNLLTGRIALVVPLRKALESMPSSKLKEQWGFAGEIASYILGQNWKKLGGLCLQSLELPSQLLARNRLPGNITINRDILNATPLTYIDESENGDKQASWMIDCLQSMTQMQEANAVILLLEEADDKTLRQDYLIAWLKQRYGPHAQDTRWSLLSSRAKSRIQALVGLATYNDFCRIADRVIRSVALDDGSRKRIQSRTAFWSNYSDRFERLIVFLPRSTAGMIGIVSQSLDMRTLTDNGSEETEICLFDFGSFYVAEFFRGSASETRLFARNCNKWVEALFANLEQPSIQCFRCQSNSESHDHTFLWQNSCERWLHSHGIKPNEGLTSFAGKDRSYKYSIEAGLPPPKSVELAERQSQLPGWRNKLERLQNAASNGCCGRFS